jgi:hypothetical protein
MPDCTTLRDSPTLVTSRHLEDIRSRPVGAIAEIDAVTDVVLTILRGALEEVERLLLDEAGAR